MPQYLERKCILKINEVLPFVEPKKNNHNKPTLILKDGTEVNIFSLRLLTFRDKGIICNECGQVADYFAVERHRNGNTSKWHLNLYGIDSEGNEVLFTQDHIIPKARGGKDYLGNLQTLCYPCNQKKGKR
jgi:hypothetical protein